MKKLIVLLSYALLMSPLYSQIVGTQQAAEIASNYFTTVHPGTFAKADVNLSMTRNDGNEPLFYVFNVGLKGFVIVSGDLAVTPVLAFSDEGAFVPENMAPALAYWLDSYAQSIAAVKAEKGKPVHPGWKLLGDSKNLKSLKGNTKGALLTTKWDQTSGYNDECPVHQAGPGGKCVTGCVATALAQVLKFYNYPEQGIGSHSYVHPFYGTISADFTNTTYDYASMTAVANGSSRAAISHLIFHCGVAVDMYYTPIESGSSNYKSYLALKNYFHYRPSVGYFSKSDYSNLDWRIMLRDNLDQDMPILYSGSGSGGGHAWVCDGYSDTTKFHFNWGWGGSNNGYFTLENLNPGGYDFTFDQDAILGIAPYFAPYCQEGRVLTDNTKTFGDGSGYSYYWNNSSCDWLIKPASAQKVLLLFNEFKLEEGKDFVSVYDGTSTSGILLGTFTGHDYPPALTANSGKMFITFSSDAQNQDLGWNATYSAVFPAGIEGQSGNEGVAVWPVPATDYLNLLLSQNITDKVVINIYDIAGKLTHSESRSTVNGQALQISVSELSSGAYILEVTSKETRVFRKFVK